MTTPLASPLGSPMGGGGFGRNKKDKKPEMSEEEKFVLKLQQDVSEYFHIWRAASYGQTKHVERLLEESHVKHAHGHVDAYEPESGNTALILASRGGHLRCVQLLVHNGRANVNLAGWGGLTALHHAAKNDHQEVLKFLLDEAKANFNAEDDSGNTALSIAARMGNLKCVEILSSKGANIDHKNKRSCTPFMISVLNCRTALVEWLIKRPIDINQTDSHGNSALHYAAKNGFLPLTRTLLMNNIKATLSNLDGHRAEDVALGADVKELIHNYVQVGASALEPKRQSLINSPRT